jgi:23S rRNA pseudouridine1911/1915/1917 synthase
MENHRIQKQYLALVHGWPSASEWRVDAPLLRQGSLGPSAIWLKQAVHPQGAQALTYFQCLQNFEREIRGVSRRFALVHARPVTGRMHQIRVHLSQSGHSIVGDKIYGEDETCYLDFIQTGWTPDLENRLLLPRHALHASALTLEESRLSWSCPLPGDLQAFLTRQNPPASGTAHPQKSPDSSGLSRSCGTFAAPHSFH